VLAMLFVVALLTDQVKVSWLFFFAIIGLLLYRRIRNRRHRLVRRFVAKLKKKTEVRVICLHQESLTVVVDEAQGTLYSLISGMVEGINRRLYFGQPVTSRVRENVPPSELSQILQQPGVLYVRKDVAALARASATGGASSGGGSVPPPQN